MFLNNSNFKIYKFEKCKKNILPIKINACSYESNETKKIR